MAGNTTINRKDEKIERMLWWMRILPDGGVNVLSGLQSMRETSRISASATRPAAYLINILHRHP
ncbi:hypothetical protein E5A44_00365 [Salmonella enterica subsp. enterica serovar Lubbock]|uniref:Uncharacterized protein n=5 Tax=Salmonella enterica TaxID=28901 RepID=A0A606XQU7_SALER|nr:hypothetical protein CHC43_18190 [Salmonella enterica subsp. enterica serovar Mbandaka]AYJ65920.1 hypothetical protein D8S90_23630 [Salmonella enterica subsp. enterica serovar Lubbock]EAA0459343.1 hypothetical protein [Salmonella enterica]EAA5788028.1 hypothetical protein [Salmonella enterica subsp. enterica]EAA7661110.1 hypothetical protein [Salmonella enterica subsp. enterica serovar Havana]EAA7951414.1 hypothetical protein [Salmonella enterica subsp. enterica serovar Altona]EBE7965665.1